MSGGRSTVGHAKGKRLATQAGDISSISTISHKFIQTFLCECKFYKDLNFIGLLHNKGHLVEFWHEVKLQAKRYNKNPLLIAKQNRYPTVVCLDRAGYYGLGLKGRAVFIIPKLGMRVVLFDDFLKHAVRL